MNFAFGRALAAADFQRGAPARFAFMVSALAEGLQRLVFVLGGAAFGGLVNPDVLEGRADKLAVFFMHTGAAGAEASTAYGIPFTRSAAATSSS